MPGPVLLLTTHITMLGDTANGEPPQQSYLLDAFAVTTDGKGVVEQLRADFPTLAEPLKEAEFETLKQDVQVTLQSWRGTEFVEAERHITL